MMPQNIHTQIHQAYDILSDPAQASLPRSRAYVKARNRFWAAFPPSGRYQRLHTSGGDLECAFHALRISVAEQRGYLPSYQVGSSPSPPQSRSGDESSAVVSTVEGTGTGTGPVTETETPQEVEKELLPIPTLASLRGIFTSMSQQNSAFGMFNTNNFSADQLAAVFAEWGAERGLRCQLGYVADDGVPVLVNTARVTTDDEGDDVVRVWVYNDGASLRGEMGHYEGISRVDDRKGGESGEGRKSE